MTINQFVDRARPTWPDASHAELKCRNRRRNGLVDLPIAPVGQRDFGRYCTSAGSSDRFRCCFCSCAAALLSWPARIAFAYTRMSCGQSCRGAQLLPLRDQAVPEADLLTSRVASWFNAASACFRRSRPFGGAKSPPAAVPAAVAHARSVP